MGRNRSPENSTQPAVIRLRHAATCYQEVCKAAGFKWWAVCWLNYLNGRHHLLSPEYFPVEPWKDLDIVVCVPKLACGYYLLPFNAIEEAICHPVPVRGYETTHGIWTGDAVRPINTLGEGRKQWIALKSSLPSLASSPV